MASLRSAEVCSPRFSFEGKCVCDRSVLRSLVLMLSRARVDEEFQVLASLIDDLDTLILTNWDDQKMGVAIGYGKDYEMKVTKRTTADGREGVSYKRVNSFEITPQSCSSPQSHYPPATGIHFVARSEIDAIIPCVADGHSLLRMENDDSHLAPPATITNLIKADGNEGDPSVKLIIPQRKQTCDEEKETVALTDELRGEETPGEISGCASFPDAHFTAVELKTKSENSFNEGHFDWKSTFYQMLFGCCNEMVLSTHNRGVLVKTMRRSIKQVQKEAKLSDEDVQVHLCLLVEYIQKIKTDLKENKAMVGSHMHLKFPPTNSTVMGGYFKWVREKDAKVGVWATKKNEGMEIEHKTGDEWDNPYRPYRWETSKGKIEYTLR
eukprot:GHVN01080970.1.p1 GENE.GHVN01080970.1~~GHVN01080970.1.p1  ORF type:complete len:381 (-),score=76.60 GHVN01080970.1:1043-2185(-)